MRKLAIAFALSALFPFTARAENVLATLTGYEEVPATVSTVAAGSFRALISQDEQFIDYELSYSGLQGTVTQGHIHFAQQHVSGPIVVWLCQTTAVTVPVGINPPTCPPSTQSGVAVTGTIRASDVLATAAAQQIAAGELEEVIAAMRAGAAYVNVHSSISPGGEIRGQIRASRRP